MGCSYSRKIDQYLGNDLTLWRSLIDTKSKSIIRITCQDQKQPTHLEIIRYVKENYYDQTIDTVTKIESVMTEEVIGVIMNKYKEVLSVKKRSLIINYLLSKKQLLKTVYMGGIL